MNVKVKILGAALLLLTAACGNDSDENVVFDGNINGHEYVDLGLSVKWATCNVGASSPEEYGDYFAWGETSPKNKYTENLRMIFRYLFLKKSIAGNPQHDAARANWGGTWRLPTADEIDELVDKCKWTWTTPRGEHTGYKITGPNGNSIFLPAAGWLHGPSLGGAGEVGNYWSATPYKSDTNGAYHLYFYGSSFFRYLYNPDRAYSLGFDSGGFDGYWYYRNRGQAVRPVSE